MAAQNLRAPLLESQSSGEGGLPFKLANGEYGEIAPGERRTYDHIIYCNVGAFSAAGLTGQYPALRSPIGWSY